MKTQLLEDLEESGSAPAPGPVQAAPAAQPSTPRRRAVADLLLQRATDAEGFDAARSRQRAPEGNSSGALPQPAPEPKRSGGADLAAALRGRERPSGAVPAPATGAPPPTHEPIVTDPETPHSPAPDADAGAAAPEDVAATDDLPAWLSERLREDEEREAARDRRRRWMRRALAGGATAALLALLAGAGWWVVQENRVDGTLSVVADTRASPQTAAPLARAGVGTPASTQARAAAPALDREPATGSEAPDPATVTVPASPDAATAAEPSASDDSGLQVRVPRHRRNASASAPAGIPAAAAAPRTKAGAEAGAAHRREETLLQCRALGYDEAQCQRRGCAMTRFGLACRG
jgi:hypothetical protein